MDEALIQDAEDDVGGKDRRQQQDPLAFRRFLEYLGAALEPRSDGRRQPLVALELLDRVHGLAERVTGRQVEGDRDRRLLALMVGLQRTDRARGPRDGGRA